MDPTTLVKPDVPAVVSARLSRLSWTQWQNATMDLLHLPDLGGLETSVTKDAVTGFDNSTADLYVNDQLRADYERAAETLAARVAQDPALLRAILPANSPANMADRARAFITAFGTRAYRRPMEGAEVDSYVGLFMGAPTLFPDIDPFVAGVELTLQLFLQSPHFLYRAELATGAGVVPLSDYEVASKLSFALTNTMPDDELFSAAASSALHTVDAVKAQAERLISLPSGQRGLDHFHFQVLRLGTYDGIIRDATKFPQFAPSTPSTMRQEALLFMRWIFSQGYGVREMYTKPVTFVNAALARLYGLAGTFDDNFVRIDLDPKQRAGLLTQSGFLMSFEHGDDPDSIHRGVFVNDRVLCVQLPPPSPLATPLPPEDPSKTNRQTVEAHTSACGAGCHTTYINPAGFAFENFDVIANFRTTDRGQPIDAAGDYPFDEPKDAAGLGMPPSAWPAMPQMHTGPIDFSSQIASSSEANTCYASQWFRYLKGRDIADKEIPLVNYYGAMSRAAALPARGLVVELVTSRDFLTRIDEGP